jgi:hypothetical protein
MHCISCRYWKFNCQTTSSSAYSCLCSLLFLRGLFHNSTYIVAGVCDFNSYITEEYRLLLFSDLNCRRIIVFRMSFFLFCFLGFIYLLVCLFFVCLFVCLFHGVVFVVLFIQSVIIWAESDVVLFNRMVWHVIFNKNNQPYIA